MTTSMIAWWHCTMRNTNDNMTTSTDFHNDWAWARTVPVLSCLYIVTRTRTVAQVMSLSHQSTCPCSSERFSSPCSPLLLHALPVALLPLPPALEVRRLPEPAAHSAQRGCGLVWRVPPHHMFSEISFIKIEFSMSLKRMTPSTVPSTFFLTSTLLHWSQNLLFPLFLSVFSRFPVACDHLTNQNHHKKLAKQRSVHTSWLYWSVQYFPVWPLISQRCFPGLDRRWASCHHLQKWSCRTLWAHNLCGDWTWPSSQTLRCSCGDAHVLRF